MKTREQLEAERAKLRARCKKREDQARLDRQREFAIDRELWALDLGPLVGVPAGVMLRFRGYDRRIPDGTVGMLTKIARVRAHVDFGEHGVWTLPITDVIAATVPEQRGWTLGALAAAAMSNAKEPT